MIEQFLGLGFSSRDFAHKAHEYTDSYAQHQALGEFYDAIVPKLDHLAEVWQGRKLKRLPAVPSFEAPAEGDPLAVMKKYIANMEEMREEVCDGDRVLDNILDDIFATYALLMFKLKFLK